jgi:methylmalonyl-CoA mutase
LIFLFYNYLWVGKKLYEESKKDLTLRLEISLTFYNELFMAVNHQDGENLFLDFEQVSKNRWIEKATSDLKGEDFSKKLVWKTEDGFDIFPFYNKEDLDQIDYLFQYHNLSFNYPVSANDARNWDNLESIEVENELSANEEALDALNKGADGLIFKIRKGISIDFEKLLNGIFLNYCSVYFIPAEYDPQFLSSYINYITRQKFSIEEIKGAIFHDPFCSFSEEGKLHERYLEQLSEYQKLHLALPNFRKLCVKGDIFHNSGACISLELGCILSTTVSYLDILTDQGFSAGEVLENLQFSIATGTNFFHEIAKIKTLRILISKVAESYGVEDLDQSKVYIHSNSSIWTKTLFDPYNNLLRCTTEAMSAIIGGCNSLALLPYDFSFRKASEFSKRISRNISSILKEESYLNKVVDPAAGSFYIENLTHNLLKSSWTRFLEIENKGGFVSAFNQGFISSEVKKDKESRLKRIAERKDSLIGTNKYPNLNEKIELPEMDFFKESEEGNLLKPMRAGVELERIRYKTEKYIQSKNALRPGIFLVLIGDPVMQKLRAEFAEAFFACAGFIVTDRQKFDNPMEAAGASIGINSQLIVLCGADSDYEHIAEDFAKEVKANTKNKQLVLAGFPKNRIEKLKEAGFDEFIFMGGNAVEILERVQSKMNLEI